MPQKKLKGRFKALITAAIFVLVNLIMIGFLAVKEWRSTRQAFTEQASRTERQFQTIMDDYRQSFQLFVQMLQREIEHNPDPDSVLHYLKNMDDTLLSIEGDTFDGLYMYYQGRYLYSWDTPYSVYEDSGYIATERPWYLDAAAGNGQIVFTPPYMSYANHYILTTISQMQPDGNTVFAYDIKMGDIQTLVSSADYFDQEQIMIFDQNGTVIGSTNTDYLGGSLYATADELSDAITQARQEAKSVSPADVDASSKANEKWMAATAFSEFRQSFDPGYTALKEAEEAFASFTMNGRLYVGQLLESDDDSFLLYAPVTSILKETVAVWLVPLLIVNLLLIYLLGQLSRTIKNRELHSAYVELGQTQKRLEIALSVAQKAAAVDELTGMMNFRSFRKAMIETIESMEPDESGIFIMIDGDRFKRVNDEFGHSMGDEVIKLSAQMIVGRIRTVDLASRLHGDEFAIYVANTSDYSVARRIMDDINVSIAKEAEKRKMPAITLSAGAVAVHPGDSLAEISKSADEYLYKAKETHHGGFAAPM